MPFELRPEPHPTLRPEGEYLQRAWSQSVYPLARRMGVPIVLPEVSPQPHTHLAFEGFQYAKEHGKANEYNHRVLEAFFREGRDIGDIDVLTTLAGEVGLDEEEFQRVVAESQVSGCSPVCPATRLPGGRGRGRAAFVIGDRVLSGVQDRETLESVIDEELAKSGRGPS